MIDYFEIFCAKCRKPTRHYVLRESRLRGLKLACCMCGKQKQRYSKANRLKKYENPPLKKSSSDFCAIKVGDTSK